MTCAHSNAVEIPPQPKLSETYVRWCPDCGAISDNNGDHGAAANEWRPPTGAVTYAALQQKYEALLESWRRRRASQDPTSDPRVNASKLPSPTPLDTAEMRDLGRVGRIPLEQRVHTLCDEIDRLVADVRVLRSQLETEATSPEGTAPGSGGAVLVGNDPRGCDGIYPTTRDGRCQGCGEAGAHSPRKLPAVLEYGMPNGRLAVERLLRTHDVRWKRCPCCDEPLRSKAPSGSLVGGSNCEGMWCATYGETFVEVEAFAEGLGHCRLENCAQCDGVRRDAERGSGLAHTAVSGTIR